MSSLPPKAKHFIILLQSPLFCPSTIKEEVS